MTACTWWSSTTKRCRRSGASRSTDTSRGDLIRLWRRTKVQTLPQMTKLGILDDPGYLWSRLVVTGASRIGFGRMCCSLSEWHPNGEIKRLIAAKTIAKLLLWALWLVRMYVMFRTEFGRKQGSSMVTRIQFGAAKTSWCSATYRCLIFTLNFKAKIFLDYIPQNTKHLCLFSCPRRLDLALLFPHAKYYSSTS